MKRRAFLTAMVLVPATAGAVVGGTAIPAIVASRGKYGFVDIPRAKRLGLLGHCAVFVDGREVPLCFAFDDRDGWADCHVRFAGKYQVDWTCNPPHVFHERIHGVIEVRRR